jgi:putative SOS response-associated peptidase YedK
MCGRFVRSSPSSAIAREFNVRRAYFEPVESYNVAPTQEVAIVYSDGENVFAPSRWGFIPGWAKDPGVGSRMINARAESVADRPGWRRAFSGGRCLVVADGFYEWRKDGRRSTPVYVRLRSGRPFGFAGLMGNWVSPENKQICTCTIITTRANDLLMPVHDRMPVIIPKSGEGAWLDPEFRDREALLSLLKPYDPIEMEAYEVSPAVNSPARDTPDNIRPVQAVL